jgi:hypothetical protein
MKIIFGINAENFMKIKQGMTSGECVENKWFNMKYIGNYLSVEILLTHKLYVVIDIVNKEFLVVDLLNTD